MWTRNYYNILTALFLSDDTLSSSSAPSEYAAPIMVRLPNGNYTNVYYNTPSGINSRYGASVFSAISPGKCGAGLATTNNPGLGASDISFMIALGTGSTPATYDDYKIETVISSGLTLVSSSGSLNTSSQVDGDTHHVSSKRSFTINNSSGSNKTISEIALYTAYGNSNSTVCVYREVLDTPVTLGPSESIVVSFNRDAEIYNYTPYT